ncbi:MAG: SDR family oxidoreductase [Pseudomonadota bacterium]
MSNVDKPLHGKTAVITGAGRGIGRAIAMTFAKAGADIAICSRSADELETVRTSIESIGVRCIAGVADLTNKAATEDFCHEVIKTFGRVDILVNNAGGLIEKRKIADSDIDSWWRTVEVNIKAPYMVTRLLIDCLSEGGKIINLSTGVALRAGMQNSAYHVAKAGLHMFTEALANELQPRGIDVNNLIPGPTATSAFDDMKNGKRSTADDLLARFENNPPPGLPDVERLKHPDEVAELALYMATMPVGGPNGQTFSLARRPL